MKKLSTLFFVSLIAFALGGCATSYTPPSQYNNEFSRQYDHSYQVSWDAVLDLITEAGYKLDQVSKDSGYISIAHKLIAGDTELDCGKFDGGGLIAIARDISLANVAVRFKKLPNNESEVSVVVNGERIIRGSSTWDGSYFEREFPCESTGEFERTVLDYVSNR